MEKTIISYNRETGIIIDCTQISESEHKKARKEVEKIGFVFDSIDTDSFHAIIEKEEAIAIINELENFGYSF